MKGLETPLPLLWNTNLFATNKAMKLLDGVVDLFITNFKFSNDECARRISGVKNYVVIVQCNLVKVNEVASLVVRHLVIPKHLDCCLKPVVLWLAENLPEVTFHLMLNYVPDWKAWCKPKSCRGKTPISSPFHRFVP